ncbi:hypothetical protein Cni_G19876 [Canna indica]|uniref:Uncharacterized protein n=1 Tax=Canna indica TaxID=4628 RepID=A0AAQ3QK69_9LILI|nr:hypothetical protein Cni_G19876 [Canna indica]
MNILTICFQCGVIGYDNSNCPILMNLKKASNDSMVYENPHSHFDLNIVPMVSNDVNMDVDNVPAPSSSPNSSNAPIPLEPTCGHWFQVQRRPNRRRNPSSAASIPASGGARARIPLNPDGVGKGNSAGNVYGNRVNPSLSSKVNRVPSKKTLVPKKSFDSSASQRAPSSSKPSSPHVPLVQFPNDFNPPSDPIEIDDFTLADGIARVDSGKAALDSSFSSKTLEELVEELSTVFNASISTPSTSIAKRTSRKKPAKIMKPPLHKSPFLESQGKPKRYRPHVSPSNSVMASEALNDIESPNSFSVLNEES